MPLLVMLLVLSATPFDVWASPVPQPVPQAERQGRVVDHNGTPVAGAIVWHDAVSANPFGVPTDEQATRTDASGRFSITHPSYTPTPEKIYLHVFAKGYPINTISFDPARGDQLFVQLAPPILIEGTVTDATTGELLDGVGVVARPISTANYGGWPTGPFRDQSPEVVRSSADGTFAVPAGPGIWSVGLMRDGYLPETVDGIEVDRQPVRIEPSLTRGLDVLGRVTDAAGSPLAAAQVNLGHLSATTDGTGRFELRGLEEGSHRLAVRDGRLLLSRSIELTGEVNDLHVAFPPEAIVEGIVRDAESGEPIEGALVMLGVSGNEVTLTTDVKTDTEGRFSESVPPGRAHLTASAPQRVPFWDEKTIAGGETLTWDIELAAGTHLTGTVTDKQGQPLEATVRVKKDPWMNTRSHFYELATLTDANGRYVIENVAAGTREVTIWSRCCLAKTVEVDFDRPEVTLDAVLEHGMSISGVVTDVSEAPLKNVELQAARENGDARDRMFARTDPAGRFELTGLAPGRWTLTIRDASWVSTPVELSQSADDLVIVATPGAIIHGTIRGIDLGGRVTASRNEGGKIKVVGQSRIDRDGRYRVTGLEAGPVELELRLDTGPSFPIGTVEVLPAQEHRLDFDFDAAARANGRVVLNGETLRDYSIHWRSADGRRGSTRAMNQSGVEVPGLDDGDYWALVSAAAAIDNIWIPFTVSGGTFDIVLDGGPLRIVVIDQDGQPIEGAEIRFLNRGGAHPALPLQTNPEGAATLSFAPFGTLAMRVTAGDALVTPRFSFEPGMSQLHIQVGRSAD